MEGDKWKKWDNCNNIINKVYLKKEMITLDQYPSLRTFNKLNAIVYKNNDMSSFGGIYHKTARLV